MAKEAAKKTASKGTRRPSPTKRKTAKRELIDTGSDKRLVRREAAGKFKESADVRKSLTTDQRKEAKAKAKRGQGDKGDR